MPGKGWICERYPQTHTTIFKGKVNGVTSFLLSIIKATHIKCQTIQFFTILHYLHISIDCFVLFFNTKNIVNQQFLKRKRQLKKT